MLKKETINFISFITLCHQLGYEIIGSNDATISNMYYYTKDRNLNLIDKYGNVTPMNYVGLLLKANQRNQRILEVGDIVTHFKGKDYTILGVGFDTVAENREDRKLIVSYMSNYSPIELHSRNYEEFMSPVEEGREDNVTGQYYRFEKI